MGLFSSLSEILSGRRLHKSKTNNVVIATLWRRCDHLPDNQQLFRDLVVRASSVADQFFFAVQRPKEIDARNYSVEQFSLFYDAVMTFCAYAEGVAHPELMPRLKRCLSLLAGDGERVERLMVRLERHAVIDRAAVGLVYAHLMEEAGVGVPAPVPFTTFTAACLAACEGQGSRIQ